MMDDDELMSTKFNKTRTISDSNLIHSFDAQLLLKIYIGFICFTNPNPLVIASSTCWNRTAKVVNRENSTHKMTLFFEQDQI